MLHPELLAPRRRRRRRSATAIASITPKATSKPLRPQPEPQPRGAKVHGNRPVDQAEAAERFIAAPSTRRSTTSACGTCARSATARCTASPSGRSCARSPRRSRSTRSPISTDYLEEFEAQRASERRPRALGTGCRRAQPDRPRHPERPRRQVAGQEQVDAHRGVRHAALPGVGGIEVIETDLGERIQQLDDEDPSHVVVPAVHKLQDRRRRGVRQDDRHRPDEQRRPLSRRGAARGDPAADPRRPTPA